MQYKCINIQQIIYTQAIDILIYLCYNNYSNKSPARGVFEMLDKTNNIMGLWPMQTNVRSCVYKYSGGIWVVSCD